jgi:peptide/nickel transport system substrate-binding protein
MKRTWLYSALALLAITAVLLAGCATPTPPPPTEAPTEPPPTEAPTEEPTPEPAMIVTIKLNQDAMWSDGTAVTADDYVFVYDMIMDEGNLIQTRYPYDTFVDYFKAVDEYTLEIGLNDAYVGWSSGLNMSPLPKHVLGPVFEEEGSIDDADWNWNPTVGTGPFVLTEWESASHLGFDANPDYWRGAPTLDQLFIRIVPDDEAQMAALETGDADIGVYLTADDEPAIAAMENVDLVSVSGGWVESWFLNLVSEDLAAETGIEPGHVALQDKNVRQAIAMGIDRQEIIDELFYGLYRIPVALWYDSPYEHPTLEAWPHDPVAAADLLDAAGWVDSNGDGCRDKDGVELVLRYSTTQGNETREATQVIVQDQLAEIGVCIEILNYSYDVIWNGYGDGGPIALGQYDIAEWSTLPWDYPDPNTGDWLCEEIPSDDYPAGGNWQGVCFEELDDLMSAQIVELDEPTRIDMFHDIQEFMHDQVFYLGMRTDTDFWAVNTRLQNARFSGSGYPFYNVYEWDTTDDSKSVTFSFFEEPDNLNPLYTGMWFTDITCEFWLERLWLWDDGMNLIPVLAAEVPSVENGGIVITSE